MLQDNIKRIIIENQKLIHSKSLISRDINIPNTNSITVLIGIRRCGKTYTLYEKAQNFPKEDILFLDFEDERLLILNTLNNYDIIIDSYKSIYPDKKPILFFDEIQNLKNWHLYLKRLHVQDYKIYVTGSNAQMLSSEIATFLKGRSLETKIYPFSFPEFLKLKQVSLSKSDIISNQAKIQYLFDEYMKYGGFPDVIKAEKSHKRIIAQNIYNLLFYKDLIAKYHKNDYLLKLVVNKIVENITKEFSTSSLAKKIISIYKTSIPTINEYLSILPEPFLSSNIYKYKQSFIERQSKRKTYLTDNSFIFLNRVTNDYSRLFENLVFTYLQRKYDELYYYKTSNGKEVDFYIHTPHKKLLIQVSYSIENSETKQREITSLLKAMKELEVSDAYIYTYNYSETIEIENKQIIVLPFWKTILK